MSTYPLVVNGQSMDYANDGSAVIRVTTTPRNNTGAVTLADKNSLIAVNATNVEPQLSGIVVVFPEPRDLTGYAVCHEFSTGAACETWTSPDTTNGVDGSWTRQKTGAMNQRFYTTAGSGAGFEATMRNVEPLSLTNIRGFEIRSLHSSLSNLFGMWIFGTYVPTAALRFWHPTLDVELPNTGFDFGDVVRGTTVDLTFRVKNMHTLTANSVSLSASALLNGLQAGLTFSNGGAFSGTLALGNLAPGALSPVITARRTATLVETNNVLGRCKITATPVSFS